MRKSFSVICSNNIERERRNRGSFPSKHTPTPSLPHHPCWYFGESQNFVLRPNTSCPEPGSKYLLTKAIGIVATTWYMGMNM